MSLLSVLATGHTDRHGGPFQDRPPARAAAEMAVHPAPARYRGDTSRALDGDAPLAPCRAGIAATLRCWASSAGGAMQVTPETG